MVVAVCQNTDGPRAMPIDSPCSRDVPGDERTTKAGGSVRASRMCERTNIIDLTSLWLRKAASKSTTPARPARRRKHAPTAEGFRDDCRGAYVWRAVVRTTVRRRSYDVKCTRTVRRVLRQFSPLATRSCLSVCQTITFESLDVESSQLYIRYISREYGSSSYMKVIGSRSRSQQQRGRLSLFPQCTTSSGNNSGSVKHTAMKFACSVCGFSDTADRMEEPLSLLRDRK